MSGLNTTWMIPHEHAKHVEGTTFVRVPGSHNASLLKLVCENNPLAEGLNLRSLASSCGLMQLRMDRNVTQATQLSAPASTLFAAESVTPRKARRMSRGALHTLRRISSSMEIEVQLGGCKKCIQVLKPVSAKDALYVEFEANTMETVIQFLRESGFAPDNSYQQIKHNGEKGIQRRKDGKFLVKKQLGKHKSQIVSTLWEALHIQMGNATNGDGNAEDQPMAMQNAANGDCNGEGAQDPAMDMENAANRDGNGEGAGDPPIGVERGAKKKRSMQPMEMAMDT